MQLDGVPGNNTESDFVAELHKVVCALVCHLEELYPASAEGHGKLSEIAQSVVAATTALQIRESRETFALELQRRSEIRASEQRPGQGQPVNQQARVPQYGNPRSRPGSSAQPGFDPLTGLADRSSAQSAILGLKGRASGRYLVMCFVQRLEHFNAQFGTKIGDELLFLTAQRIANSLTREGDQLFRWGGPAFVAILQRDDDMVAVRSEVSRFVGSSTRFSLRGGAMLASVGLATQTLAASGQTCAQLIAEIDKYFLLGSTRGL